MTIEEFKEIGQIFCHPVGGAVVPGLDAPLLCHNRLVGPCGPRHRFLWLSGAHFYERLLHQHRHFRFFADEQPYNRFLFDIRHIFVVSISVRAHRLMAQQHILERILRIFVH